METTTDRAMPGTNTDVTVSALSHNRLIYRRPIGSNERN